MTILPAALLLWHVALCMTRWWWAHQMAGGETKLRIHTLSVGWRGTLLTSDFRPAIPVCLRPTMAGNDKRRGSMLSPRGLLHILLGADIMPPPRNSQYCVKYVHARTRCEQLSLL